MLNEGFTQHIDEQGNTVRNVGWVTLSPQAILRFLDLVDGIVVNAYTDRQNNVQVVIEHPDMPELQESHSIRNADFLYQGEGKLCDVDGGHFYHRRTIKEIGKLDEGGS